MRHKLFKAWIALFILAVAIALLYDSQSIERVTYDAGRIEPIHSELLQAEQSPPSAGVLNQSRLAAGVRYNSLEELVNSQLTDGFVRTGYFGKHWPARVVEIATDRHKISFVRQDGTRHNYTKFHGYDMKMVRLRAGSKETIVVFRSQYKK